MFCKFCGKEILEGEVCFCEEAVNERTGSVEPKKVNTDLSTQIPEKAAAFGKSLLNALKQLFTQSDATYPLWEAVSIAVITLGLTSLGGVFLGIGFKNWLDSLMQSIFKHLSSLLTNGFYSADFKAIGGWIAFFSYLVGLGITFLTNLCYRLKEKDKGRMLRAFGNSVFVCSQSTVILLVAGLLSVVNTWLGIIGFLMALIVSSGAYIAMKDRLRSKPTTMLSLLTSALVIALQIVFFGTLALLFTY